MIYEELDKFYHPTVEIEYIELGDYIDFSGNFNDYEINEDFSELNSYQEYISHVRKELKVTFNKLNSFEKLLNIKERLLVIKEQYKIINEIYFSKRKKQEIVNKYYYHTNINYIQNGNKKFFKVENSDWVAYDPKYISPFLSLQYNCILSLITELDLEFDTNEKDIPLIKIKSNKLNIIIDFFKDYFSSEDLILLKSMLKGKEVKSKITFKENANKLIDAFRRLHVNNVFIDLTKASLVNWIIDNFNYKNENQILDLKKSYVTNLLSKKDKIIECKEPIFDFKQEFPYPKDYFQ